MSEKMDHFLSHRLSRISYDVVASVVVFALAFMSRAIFELATNKYGDDQLNVFRGYLEHFTSYGWLFALSTVICFATLGFYSRSNSTDRRNVKPLRVGLTALVPVLLFNVVMHLISPTTVISRGVVIFLAFYSLIFLAGPRLLKFYLLKKLNIEVQRKKRREKPKRVLLLGGAGYVGSHLSSELLGRGYHVRILDSMLFGEESIRHIMNNPKLDLHVGDFRNVETLVSAMKDVDAVIHLAGIVGDPACSLDNDFTIDVNLTATSLIGEVCKTFGVQRLIFASSCSVYGQNEDSSVPLTEESELNPVSLYARTKIASENVLMKMKSENLQPTILRFATLFGLSPRPRFDLAVNILSARAATLGKINVFGGAQWRPFVHVRDTAKAIIAILEAPIEKVGGEVFNIGSNENNYTINTVGEMIKEIVPATEVVVDDSQEDGRNYFVGFDKLKNKLGVTLEISVEDGIREIVKAVNEGKITDISAPIYSNLKITDKVITEHINHADGKSHHKKTSKTLLQGIVTKH